MNKNTNTTTELPLKGLSRFEQIKPYIGMSRSSFLALVEQKKAPQPQRLSQRMSVYRNEDVHRFIQDPLNFKVED